MSAQFEHERYDVVVVGGGPAGMLAAGVAAEEGASVLLLEKMEQCGRKLRITGKGRCNITNLKEWEEFATHIHPRADFFRPAFRGFSNSATVRFFQSIGVDVVIERGDRVFPECQDARRVTEALVSWMHGKRVNVLTGAKVFAFECADHRIQRVKYTKDGREWSVEPGRVVLATGGYSYPATGSTGDGYRLAETMGHTIMPCFPSLTALMPQAYDPRLQGISLSNVRLSLWIDGNPEQEEFGEMAFTDLGIEGPLGLRLSRRAVTAISHGAKVVLVLNLKPARTQEQLSTRFERECAQFGEWSPEVFLRRYLPQALILPFIKAIPLRASGKVSALSPAQKEALLQRLQHWEFPIERHGGFDRAVVTAGGISLNEIRKKDMCSKMAENLFFAGEIIDLDGDTGGYNLQIAFSTGVLAGSAAARRTI